MTLAPGASTTVTSRSTERVRALGQGHEARRRAGRVPDHGGPNSADAEDRHAERHALRILDGPPVARCCSAPLHRAIERGWPLFDREPLHFDAAVLIALRAHGLFPPPADRLDAARSPAPCDARQRISHRRRALARQLHRLQRHGAHQLFATLTSGTRRCARYPRGRAEARWNPGSPAGSA